MNWEGKDVKSSQGAELYSLSIGQVILAILMFLSYFGIAILILGIELIFSKLNPKTRTQQAKLENDEDSTKGIEATPFDSLMMNLDAEYINRQYEEVESYFKHHSNYEKEMSETFLNAIKTVKQIECLKDQLGKHEKPPWIFHNQIMTFEFKKQENQDADGINQEVKEDVIEILELE